MNNLLLTSNNIGLVVPQKKQPQILNNIRNSEAILNLPSKTNLIETQKNGQILDFKVPELKEEDYQYILNCLQKNQILVLDPGNYDPNLIYTIISNTIKQKRESGYKSYVNNLAQFSDFKENEVYIGMPVYCLEDKRLYVLNNLQYYNCLYTENENGWCPVDYGIYNYITEKLSEIDGRVGIRYDDEGTEAISVNNAVLRLSDAVVNKGTLTIKGIVKNKILIV